MGTFKHTRVVTSLCPHGGETAWAGDKPACPPYDFFENEFTLGITPWGDCDILFFC
jgi:hypothetical protein